MKSQKSTVTILRASCWVTKEVLLRISQLERSQDGQTDRRRGARRGAKSRPGLAAAAAARAAARAARAARAAATAPSSSLAAATSPGAASAPGGPSRVTPGHGGWEGVKCARLPPSRPAGVIHARSRLKSSASRKQMPRRACP